ncbi:hypothetical protein GCM10010411_61900 [Actinomadura fulvescens]|uniref:Uncharacterized protein n=1 Tax=Actinomadura fulvescens TaxID=46160 RepID=A0ABP6CF45_9ACTN
MPCGQAYDQPGGRFGPDGNPRALGSVDATGRPVPAGGIGDGDDLANRGGSSAGGRKKQRGAET